MRHFVLPIIAYVLPFGTVLLIIAWVLPSLLDSASIGDRMLLTSYQLPELVGTYIAELIPQIRWCCLGAVATALCGFGIWALTELIARPTGPRQVRGGWRPPTWYVLAFLVALSAYFMTYLALTNRLGTVDNAAAIKFSVFLGVVSVLVFWVLSLLGTELMLRPAVPFGARFLRGSA